MHLAYSETPSIDDEDMSSGLDFISDVIDTHLDLRPFRLEQQGICLEGWPGTMALRRSRPFRVVLNFRLSVPVEEGDVCRSLGVRKANKEPQDARASWRRMKLQTLPTTVVTVCVTVRNYVEVIGYEEVVDFGAGQGCLGEVIDAMDWIRKRSLLLHKARKLNAWYCHSPLEKGHVDRL